MSEHLKRWHEYTESHDFSQLEAQVHDDAVFHSPVVHTPQVGKALVLAYLHAATQTFAGSGFRYVRELDCGDRAALEFVAEIDGIHINGVDLIEWDSDGKMTEFKVLVRPLKAIQMLHGKMAQMLEQMQEA